MLWEPELEHLGCNYKLNLKKKYMNTVWLGWVWPQLSTPHCKSRWLRLCKRELKKKPTKKLHCVPNSMQMQCCAQHKTLRDRSRLDYHKPTKIADALWWGILHWIQLKVVSRKKLEGKITKCARVFASVTFAFYLYALCVHETPWQSWAHVQFAFFVLWKKTNFTNTKHTNIFFFFIDDNCRMRWSSLEAHVQTANLVHDRGIKLVCVDFV